MVSGNMHRKCREVWTCCFEMQADRQTHGTDTLIAILCTRRGGGWGEVMPACDKSQTKRGKQPTEIIM